MYPENLLYHKEHLWALPVDKTATVGLSDYAQSSLGDIVYIDLPPVGSVVQIGMVCGDVESVKIVADLNSPLSGTVVEVNQAVIDTPEIINNDPYGAGWLFRLTLSDPAETATLMSADEYRSFVSQQEGNLAS